MPSQTVRTRLSLDSVSLMLIGAVIAITFLPATLALLVNWVTVAGSPAPQPVHLVETAHSAPPLTLVNMR